MLGDLGDIQATLHVEVHRATGLAVPPGAHEFKPYVRIKFNRVERETDYSPGQSPTWQDTAFEFACSNVNLSASLLTVEVWNWHMDADHEFLGRAEIPIQTLVPHEHVEMYSLRAGKGEPERGQVGLVLYFTHAAPRLFEVRQGNMEADRDHVEEEQDTEPCVGRRPRRPRRARAREPQFFARATGP